MTDDIFILGGARTPMADYTGRLKDFSALDLGAIAARAAMARTGVSPASVDHVVFGNVLQTSADAVYGARHVGLKAGVPMCVTVTILDGLVLARSAFHHSMNYRSVVVLGIAQEVTNSQEKYDALKAIVEHVAPNHWDDVRWPTEQELKATSVLRLPLEEVSAKIRTGPPIDDEEDYQLPCWAGELPLRLMPQVPVPDPRLSLETSVPSYVRAYQRPRSFKKSL